jgi:hypothetical protein
LHLEPSIKQPLNAHCAFARAIESDSLQNSLATN